MTTEATTIATETAEPVAETLAETLAAVETAATEGGLDMESLKEMMDGFDPASLLPQLDSIFEKMELICRIAVTVGPIVLIIMGLVYLFLTPKEANYYIGYRCYHGMGSVQAWRYTQRIAGLVFGGLGLVLTVIMLFVSGSFASLAVEDMAFKALSCLVWQAILTVLATIAVHGLVIAKFDRNGEYRKKGN